MITFVRLIKKQYELLPFGALCNFTAEMHTITTIKFGKLNLWMQISLIILFMANIAVFSKAFIYRSLCEVI